MSKAVKWQIPFATNNIQNPTLYRLDIYAEGYTGDPIQLTAGETPFVTEEDSSEDFFAPIRTQTGSIQVCTRKPDGTMLTLDEILPANNIDHPVRLIRKDNSTTPATETIEWQGFLSCEAYSQNYTAIPENLTLSVISVLEAMDSVQLDQIRSSGLATIAAATYNALNEIVVQSGMSFFTHINYSMTSWQIFNKYIDQTVFFEQKEYNNENSTTYIVSGLSAKEALERLCKFMGWTAREQGTQLYLEYIGETMGMYKETFIGFGTAFHPTPTPAKQIDEIDIADLEWRGVDHKRDIRQGAKSVEVVAKVETNDFSLNLPDFPYGDATTLSWVTIKYKSNTWKYFYGLFNKNNEAYSNISYGYYSGELTRTGDSSYTFNFLGESTKSAFFDRMSLLSQSPQPYISNNPLVAGAVFMRYAIEDSVTDTHDLQTGLYCPLLPTWSGHDAPIFKMWTPKKAAFLNGHFYIKADMLFNALYRYNSLGQEIMSDNISDSYIACDGEKLDMVLRVGDKYWDGSDWVTTRTIFQATMTGNGIDIDIPVEQYLSGQVQIEILAGVTITHVNTLYEVIFKSLEVSFEYNEDYQASDRSENHYFRILDTNFRDEISISTDIASDLDNQPSPSVIMDDEETQASSIDYTTSGGTESRRPEIDLLNRLATYYGASRQTLDLIVKHPTLTSTLPLIDPTAILPLLKLNGIGDGKVYLPLAESRNWKTEECTLRCFESPEEPETPSES